MEEMINGAIIGENKIHSNNEKRISVMNFSKNLSQCTAYRLTETARLLRNVKSVFTRRSNAATRVNVEVELSHGFAFSQEEGGSVTQTDVIRAYDTNLPKPGGM